MYESDRRIRRKQLDSRRRVTVNAAIVLVVAIACCSSASTADALGLDDGANAQAAYDVGCQHLQAARYDDAIKQFTMALEINGRFVEAYNNRAVAFIEKKRFDDCVRDCDSALKINSKFALAYFNRGRALQMLERPKEACENFTAAIELDPTNALAFTLRAATYFDTGRLRDVIRDTGDAIRLDPANALAFSLSAMARCALGEVQAALADSEKAVILGPSLAIAYQARSLSLACAGDFGKAIHNADEALQRDPGLNVALGIRSFCHNAKGQYDQAVEDSKKALVIQPKYAFALQQRGIARLGKNETDQARVDFKTALSIEPSAALYSLLGTCAFLEGDTANSLRLLTKAQEMAPGDNTIIAIQAVILDATGDRRRSEQMFSIAKPEIERVAANGSAFWQFQLARMYHAGIGIRRDSRRAFEWFKKSADQGNADAMYNVGVYQLKGIGGVRHNVPLAIASLRKARELGSLDACVELGNLFENGDLVTRDSRTAREYFEEASRKGSAIAMARLAEMEKDGPIRQRIFREARDKATDPAMQKLFDLADNEDGRNRELPDVPTASPRSPGTRKPPLPEPSIGLLLLRNRDNAYLQAQYENQLQQTQNQLRLSSEQVGRLSAYTGLPYQAIQYNGR